MLTERQLAAVLAGLRALQNVQQHEPLASEIMDVMTNGGSFPPLDDEEIDHLCDCLNFAPGADGPYRPELAAAFREGARELQIDRLHVEDDAQVEESEGGAVVHCTVYVSDAERLSLADEDAEPQCPHCGETYNINWVATLQPCPHCNGLIEQPRQAA